MGALFWGHAVIDRDRLLVVAKGRTELIKRLQAEIVDSAKVRDDAVRALVAGGMSAYEVSQVTGLSKAAAYKIAPAGKPAALPAPTMDF